MNLPRPVFKFAALGILAVSLASNLAHAYAGGSSPGGGVGLSCMQTGGSEKIYLADTFQLAASGQFAQLQKSRPVDLVQVSAGLLDKLEPQKKYDSPLHDGTMVTLGWMINYRHQHMKFIPNFSASLMLPTLNDDHIDASSLPSGCHKVQLAVQDISTKTVEQSPLIYQLSWPERGFLELHETLISLRDAPGSDTTPIRREVSALAIKIESADPSLLRQIAKLLPDGPADYCYEERATIDQALAAIRADRLSTKNMCEPMFKVGNEFLMVGVTASSGWGGSNKAVMQSCIDQTLNDVKAKVASIRDFNRICQEVVAENSKEDFKKYGGNETPWNKEYYFGYSFYGLKSYEVLQER